MGIISAIILRLLFSVFFGNVEITNNTGIYGVPSYRVVIARIAR